MDFHHFGDGDKHEHHSPRFDRPLWSFTNGTKVYFGLPLGSVRFNIKGALLTCSVCFQKYGLALKSVQSDLKIIYLIWCETGFLQHQLFKSIHCQYSERVQIARYFQHSRLLFLGNATPMTAEGNSAVRLKKQKQFSF